LTSTSPVFFKIVFKVRFSTFVIAVGLETVRDSPGAAKALMAARRIRLIEAYMSINCEEERWKRWKRSRLTLYEAYYVTFEPGYCCKQVIGIES